MLIRKPNIGALISLRHEWKGYIQQNFTGDNYDAYIEVEYITLKYHGKGKPSTWKCNGAGFNTIVTERFANASVIIMVKFFQVKDGIKWTISRVGSHVEPHKAIVKVLHSGIVRDCDILTNNPVPTLVTERLLMVAKAAVDIAKVERTLMCI